MRLAFITSSFPPYTSGVATHSVTISQGLSKMGHQIDVLTASYHLQTTPHVIPLPSIDNPTNPSHKIILPSPQIISMLSQLKPEIIHLQEPLFYIFPQIQKFAKFHKIPISTSHFFPPQYISGRFGILGKLFSSPILHLAIRLYNQTNLVITPTQTMATLLKNHGLKTPVQIISCGVDTHKFCPPPVRAQSLTPNAPVILYLGRVDPEKNLNVLVAASQLIASPHEIWIAGNGKSLTHLKRLAQKLKVATRVKFLGFVPESQKADLYRQATIFVMPSPAESQSIASLEAAACGLPLLLANAAALPELIDPTFPNGLLFDPNKPWELATRIDQMLLNKGAFQHMSKNSRRLALKHDFQKILIQYEKAFLDLIN